MSEFGDYLRARREERKLSLRELARQLDLSPTYISHIETGRCPSPGIETLHKIARVMKLDFRGVVRIAGRGPDLAAALVRAHPHILDAVYDFALASAIGRLFPEEDNGTSA